MNPFDEFASAPSQPVPPPAVTVPSADDLIAKATAQGSYVPSPDEARQMSQDLLEIATRKAGGTAQSQPQESDSGNPFAQFVEPPPAAAPQPSAQPPAKTDAITGMGLGFIDSLLAGTQGTSPVVKGVEGTQNYTLAPQSEQDLLNSDLGQPSDQQKYVVLRNPDTQKLAVYYRSPKMAESGLISAGRVLGTGTLAGPLVRAPGVVGQAATNAGTDLLNAFKETGVSPTVGAISGNRPAQIAENFLSNTPGGGTAVQNARKASLGQTQQAATDLAGQFGPVQTTEGVGGTIRKGAAAAADRFAARQGDLYDQVWNAIGEDTPVPVNNSLNVLRQLRGEMSAAPQSLSPTLGPTIDRLSGLVSDATTSRAQLLSQLRDEIPNAPANVRPILRVFRDSLAGIVKQEGSTGIPFGTLKQIRTNLGQDLANPVVMGSSGSANSALKRAYAALSADMEAAAAKVPGGAEALAKANRYTRFNMNVNAPVLEKIAKMGSDEQVFRYAFGTGQNAQQLRRVMANLKPEERDAIAGTVLGRMGLGKPGAQGATALGEVGDTFSPATFMTRWNTMSPEARQALFGGSRYADLQPALDKLVKVVNAQKDVEKLSNTSHTAGQVLLGVMLEHFGDIHTLIGSAIGTYGAAKLMTSPRFIDWLYKIPQAKTQSDIATRVAQLGQIARSSPDIAEAVSGLKTTLERAMTGGQSVAPAGQGSTARPTQQ